MKKMYEKPILDTKAYAQFEDVFAHCNHDIGEKNCGIVNDKPTGFWVENPSV